MGSGGSYSPILKQDQEARARLEASAKQELEKAKAARRNVFISFAAEDIDEVNMLRGQAKNPNSPMDFVDRSVREPYDSKRADYIKQRISERIRQASMTVVLLTDNSVKSQWVDWEIERSLELGRKVVAFHVGDSLPKSLPSAVVKNKIKIVPWRDLPSEFEPPEW